MESIDKGILVMVSIPLIVLLRDRLLNTPAAWPSKALERIKTRIERVFK